MSCVYHLAIFHLKVLCRSSVTALVWAVLLRIWVSGRVLALTRVSRKIFQGFRSTLGQARLVAPSYPAMSLLAIGPRLKLALLARAILVVTWNRFQLCTVLATKRKPWYRSEHGMCSDQALSVKSEDRRISPNSESVPTHLNAEERPDLEAVTPMISLLVIIMLLMSNVSGEASTFAPRWVLILALYVTEPLMTCCRSCYGIFQTRLTRWDISLFKEPDWHLIEHYQAMLKEIVDETSIGKYDFMYLRIGKWLPLSA